MKKNFYIYTFGCRTNQYESEVYKEQLTKLGYNYSEKDVDIVIFNTCGVTQNAENACFSKIVKKVKKRKGSSKFYITGCSAPIFKEKLKEIKGEIDIKFVLNNEKENLVCKIERSNSYPFRLEKFSSQTRAFVKIQDGCNNFCSYCIIPFVRGRSRSRPKSDIISEVVNLVSNGFKEIVLTGINIGDYKNARDDLSSLVYAIDKIEGVQRVRLSSIDPNQISDELIDVIINGKNTAPSMHISLQSGSDNILKKMNRRYTIDQFLQVIDKLKNKRDDFTFTTDVIVGFPGETEEDFNASIDIIKAVSFAKVHMFPYSKREKTLAATFAEIVPEEIVVKRKKKLLEISEDVSNNLRSEYVGKKLKVLIEKKCGQNYFGHSEHFLPILVKGENYLRNEMVDVIIKKNEKDYLVGKRD